MRSLHSRLIAAPILALIFCCLAQPAAAQTTYTWNLLAAGNASGSWSTPGNWTPAGPANGVDSIADFSALNITATSTVTLDGSYTVGTLRFGDTNTTSAAGWVIDPGSGGTLTLATSGLTPTGPVIQVNALGGSSTATISAVLAGTHGFTKTGTGVLTLNGSVANTYTGTTSILAGTLALNLNNLLTPTNLIDPSTSLLLGGGTLSVTGKSDAVPSSQSFNGGTTVVSGTSIITQVLGAGGTSTTVNLGAITRTQPGAVLLLSAPPSATLVTTTTGVNGAPLPSGTNMSYIGGWALYGTGANTRFARVDSAGNITLSATSVTATNATAANVTDPTVVYSFNTVGSPYNVTNNLTAFGIYYNQTATATVNLQDNTFTTNGFITLNTSGLIITSTVGSPTGGVVVGPDNDLVLVVGGGGLRFSTPIRNGAAGNSNVTVVNTGGAGVVTFDTSPSTYTGLTTVNSGTLVLALDNVLSPASGIVMNGGTLSLTTFNQSVNSVKLLGGAAITGTTGTLASATAFDLQSGTVGAILGGSSAAVKTTNNAVTLSGANTFTGGLVMNGGTLALTGANAFSGGFTINAGTTTISGSGANTYTGTTTVNAGATLNLNKSGGVNAIGGNLVIAGGIVLFTSSGVQNQIPDTATVSMSAGAFNGTGQNNGAQAVTETVGGLNFTGGWFSSGSNSNWTVAGTFSATGGSGFTYLQNSGSILSTNALSLTNMTATAGATLNTPNSFSVYGAGTAVTTLTVGAGGLTLNNSVLNLRRGGSGSRLVLNGDVTTTGSTGSSIAFDAGAGTSGISVVDLNSTTDSTVTRTFAIAGGADLTVGVAITNGTATAAGITKVGSGVLILNAVNTYSGPTTVNAGTLAGTGTIAGTVAVNPGGAIRGASGTGTGNITLNGTTTVTGAAAFGTGGTIATQLTTGGGTITANSKLQMGSGVSLNLDSSNGPFDVLLLNDSGLTLNQPYTITLAQATAGTYLRNNSPYDPTTNAYVPSDFNVLSGSGNFSYSNTSLTVSGGNLVLGFTPIPVPEPGAILGVAALGLGLGRLARRRKGLSE